MNRIRELKRREEAKRNRCWPAKERWQALLKTIAWAEAQQPVPRSAPQARLAEERRMLRTLANQRTRAEVGKKPRRSPKQGGPMAATRRDAEAVGI